MRDELKQRIRDLAEQVRYHSELYYNKAKPELTDAEFDALVDELKALVEQLRADEPDAEVLSDGEQALGQIGAVPSYGKKVVHSKVMGSLEKESTVSGVKVWRAKYGSGKKLVVTPKIDGTAGRIVYKAGRMVEAATRGDGCVDGETRLETEDGKPIPIWEIVSKGLKCRVKCLDVSTGEICFREVDDVFDNGQTKDWIEITVKDKKGSHKLILTPNHQVLSLDGGKPHFVCAKNLREGEDVFGT